MDLIPVWLPATPSFLLALVALGAPGLLWAWLLGLRGRILAAASVPLSAFLMGVGAVICGVLGFWWGWVTYLIFTAVVCGITGAIRWWGTRRGGAEPAATKAAPAWLGVEIVIGVLIAALMTAWGATRAMGSPEVPVQNWDGLYHMSAAQYVFSTGHGSTLTLGSVAYADGTGGGFYPAGWHDLVALVMEATASSVIASNVTAIVVMAIVWPLGAALLTSALFPKQRFAPLAAALLASASTAFPERVASYGVLWPLLYAYALVPFVLALLVHFLRGPRFVPNWTQLGVILAAIAGLGIVHPQGVLALMVLGAPLILVRAVQYIRRPDSATLAGRVLVWGMVGAMIVGVVLIGKTSAGKTTTSYSGRTPLGQFWPELWGAITDGQLTEQGYGIGAGWWIFAVLLVLGFAATLIQRRGRWMIGSWAVAVYLYLVAATMVLPGFSLVGFWYSDAVRLGAIVPLVAVPIMATGAAWICGAIWRLGTTRAHWNTNGFAAAIGATLTVILIITTGALGRDVGRHQIWINYVYKGETGLNGFVSEEELEMIGRLAEELPADATIIGSPFTGAPMAFSVAGVNTVFRIYVAPREPEMQWLAQNFDRIGTDPKVCEILNDKGINYFYYDTVLYRLGDGSSHTWFYALENPGPVLDQLEVVDSSGTATLYRLNVCD